MPGESVKLEAKGKGSRRTKIVGERQDIVSHSKKFDLTWPDLTIGESRSPERTRHVILSKKLVSKDPCSLKIIGLACPKSYNYTQLYTQYKNYNPDGSIELFTSRTHTHTPTQTRIDFRPKPKTERLKKGFSSERER